MKRMWGAVLLMVSAAAAAAPQVGVQPQTMTLQARESRTVEVFGVTAAWSIDPQIADAAVSNGRVTIDARNVGRTQIIVSGVTGENTFEIIVTLPAGEQAITARPTSSDSGVAQVRYSSAARELHNSVTMTRERKDGRTELRVETVNYGGDTGADHTRTTLPSISYRIFRRDRELTLLDRVVDHSPLTLDTTSVRGIHYLDDRWRIHAGYTAYASYRSFLVPAERTLVGGAAYAFPLGGRSTLMPGFFAYQGRGNVASLVYRYAPEDASRLERGLRLLGEIGVSHGIGAAAQISLDEPHDRMHLDVRYRPEGFAQATAGDTRGLLADGAWTHTYGRGSSAALSVSAGDYAAVNQRALAASLDLDHRLSDRLSLLGGASWGAFNDSRSIVIPAGARVDFAHGGIGAIYRYARDSASNRGGNGVRIFGRASLGRFHVNAYIDRQQNAPTLDLIFSEEPELALALEELGIVATSPADIARALRENAELIALGFIEGVTVDLAPVRSQIGFEMVWLGGGAAQHRIRARYLRNVIEGVATRTETTIASLTYARRLTGATDLFTGYTWRRTQRRGEAPIDQPYVEAGLRHKFDGLPSFFPHGSGTISGVVFLDEDLDGVSDGSGVAAQIELDGLRSASTNAAGAFSFTGVPSGSHRVVARVPSQPDAYFTTPSRVETESGQTVSFGVARTPARVFAKVSSDAGTGVSGIRLLLVRGEKRIEAVTESNGEASIAATPGEWTMSMATESIPAGYAMASDSERTVALDRAQPLHVAFTLPALRSVSGRAKANTEINVEISAEPIGRRVRSDAEGRYAVRSLPAGELTLVAGDVRRSIVVPSEPASLTLDLTEPASTVASRSEVPQRSIESLPAFLVQLGAYRIEANAIDARDRARENGVDARLEPEHGLTIVRAGPFVSRHDAVATADRLQSAGIEAIVVAAR